MRKKQIDEMAEYIFGNAITHDTQFKEDCRSIARDLYNAGYRKQSEGEWKKVSDKSPRYKCTICNHLYNNREYKHCPFCGARMKGGAE